MLAREGAKVVIVERADSPKLRVGETLPPSIKIQLAKLGVWDEFIEAGHAPSVGNRSAWGSIETADHDFIFNPYGMGWHVDRQKFDSMLLNAAVSSGAIVLNDCSPSRCELEADGWSIEIESGSGAQKLKARIVVDASGRASAFARLCGIKRESVDKLIGITGYLEAERVKATERVTLVESVEEGWWYSALLPDDKLVVVYMTDADLPSSKQAKTREGWNKLLGQTIHTGRRIESSSYRLEVEPRIVSANSSRLMEIVGRDWLAVGDAAASYDPLSSQGISTALSFGIRAADAIEDYFKGEAAGLNEYKNLIDEMFEDYLINRSRYYAIEKRWPNSLFWRRRQCSPASAQRQIRIA